MGSFNEGDSHYYGKLPDILEAWKRGDPIADFVEIEGNVTQEQLKSLLELPFEVVILVTTSKTKYVFRGASEKRSRSMGDIRTSLKLSDKKMRVMLHSHPPENGQETNYPSFSDYFTLDSAKQRLDLIVTPAGIYDSSFYPEEGQALYETFPTFLAERRIATEHFRQEQMEKETGKKIRLLDELSHQERQNLYRQFEGQRQGPDQAHRRYDWDDPVRISTLLKVIN